MAILITGAGLVGCQAAQELVKRGEVPVLFDIAPQMDNIKRIVDPSKVKIVKGDISEPLELIAVVEKEKIDRIIHTAAYMTAAIAERPAMGIKANLMGIVNILELARIKGLRRVVFTSSNTVYLGALPYLKSELLTEDLPTMFLGGRPRWIYASTKIAGEHLGLNYQEAYGVDFVAVRFAGVFGPWKSGIAGVVTNVIRGITERFVTERKIVLDKRLTWTGKSDFVYSKDAGYSTVLACFAESPKRRVYNIAMGESYTSKDVAEILKKIDPGLEIELHEVTEEHFGPQAVAPMPALDISKAREELGYEPKYKMETAIEDYAAWHKSNIWGGCRNG